MIEDRRTRQRDVPSGGRRIPDARTGDDQPEPHRRRCARDADPAHPDGGVVHSRLPGHVVPPGQQRRPRAVQAGGDVLHRQHQVSHARRLAPYYAAIRTAAAQISSHHEKQTFLKVIYENFYKVYNPKAADRLGVVYTPNEIVRFMIESADWLCEKHFGRTLDRQGRRDPRPGRRHWHVHLRADRALPRPAGEASPQVPHELHANEVAILPYYVANLNIEATYAAMTGDYEEFPDLCFVDTLDNTWACASTRATSTTYSARSSDDNVSASASRTADDQRDHRQSAVQREPAQREREQQEPRVPGDRQADQGDLHRGEHGAEDQALRHVCAFLPVGQRSGGRERGAGVRHAIAALSTAVRSTVFARS